MRDLNRIGKLCTYANCWYMSETRVGRDVATIWLRMRSDSVDLYQRLCESFVNEPRSVYVGGAVFRLPTKQPETYGNTTAIAFNKRIELNMSANSER